MSLHSALHRQIALLATFGLLAGCGSEDDPMTDIASMHCPEMPPVASQSLAISCPPEECGSNSAEINDIPIGELHVTPGRNTGEVNAFGARLLRFVTPDGAEDFILKADNGRLSATNGDVTLEGTALIGSHLVLENTNENHQIALRIHDYSQKPSWTIEPPFMIDRYVLTFDDCAGKNFRPICTDAEDADLESAWSVIVSGERYSWSQKSVLGSGPDGRGWFNIACEGNALYEMKFMGYDATPYGDNSRITTLEQRQSALKMLTADYCGTGESFTETGTPLYWTNAQGWSENSTPPESTLEAYWDHNGALCIDTPRLGTDTLPSITEACAAAGKTLPACSDSPGAYEWKSMVPSPL